MRVHCRNPVSQTYDELDLVPIHQPLFPRAFPLHPVIPWYHQIEDLHGPELAIEVHLQDRLGLA